MKGEYNKEISLQCATCGSECSFITDEKTGIVICRKCNRKYYGGYNELRDLNQRRIDDEMRLLIDDVQSDLTNEINKMFKGLGFKIK